MEQSAATVVDLFLSNELKEMPVAREDAIDLLTKRVFAMANALVKDSSKLPFNDVLTIVRMLREVGSAFKHGDPLFACCKLRELYPVLVQWTDAMASVKNAS